MQNQNHPAFGATRLHPDDDEDDECEEHDGKPGSGYLDQQIVASRTLLISGPVTDKLAQYCAARLIVMENLHPEKPITVLINSPGGSADSGFAIYDLLRFVAPPVYTVVNGLCASAAVLIVLAAEKKHRFALPESRFLIHQPSTTGHGSASDLDITAREIIKLRERYNKIIADATSQEPEKVLADARRDFWLNSKEAVDYGLIAKVVKRRADLPT